MSEKVDTNSSNRSMSQIAPRRKRVADAWTSSPKPVLENILKKTLQESQSSEGKKTITENSAKLGKIPEENKKTVEKTIKEVLKTQETVEKNPEKTPETTHKPPEKTPEPRQKAQEIPKIENKPTTNNNIKAYTSPPPKALTPQNFIISRPNFSQSMKNIPLTEPKDIIACTPRIGQAKSPTNGGMLSPSRFNDKKSYELDDEKLEIFKQKQCSWPWAYRLGEQKGEPSEPKSITKPKDLRAEEAIKQSQNLQRKCAIVEDPTFKPMKSISPGRFIFPSCLDPSLLRSSASELFGKKPNAQREFSIQSIETEAETGPRNYRNEIQYLKGEIENYKEKERKVQENLEKTLEKHQQEIKNYKKEVDLKDARIQSINTKASEMHTELKKKITDLETKINKESTNKLTKHGQDINDLNQQVKDLEKIINNFEADKKNKEELSNKIIQDFNDMIMNSSEIIRKLEKDLLSKDKEIVELKKKMMEKEIMGESCVDRSTTRRERKNSNDISGLLRKETREKEELASRLERCEEMLREERERSQKDLEKLTRIIRDKARLS